jgi:hypothetical protein
VFDNRGLREGFGTKGKDVTGGYGEERHD